MRDNEIDTQLPGCVDIRVCSLGGGKKFKMHVGDEKGALVAAGPELPHSSEWIEIGTNGSEILLVDKVL